MHEKLAIDGGAPVRTTMLPYGRQTIDAADREAVDAALRSDWLTTGPSVAAFEEAFAGACGARHAVAVANGTAALHACTFAIGIAPGDEVIVPVLTFAASANCVCYQGGTPVFVDVNPATLLVDPAAVEAACTDRTKAVVAVDYTGMPCDYDGLTELARNRGMVVIADACHSFGGTYHGKPVGTLADLSAFSFHPVKGLTTGEGGMITTDDDELARRMREFRNHGITTDFRQRALTGTYRYDMVELGYNYRLTDLQCALGSAQLQRFPTWLERRKMLVEAYVDGLSDLDEVTVPHRPADRTSGWHLFVVRFALERLRVDRDALYRALRAENVGVNVHYTPVPWHTYYQRRGYGKGSWPIAEDAAERMLTLPLWPGMTDHDVADVVAAVEKVVTAYRR